MNVGSLFSGIGGFDLGFQRTGMHTSWFCEQDEFCQRVLAKHWPGVPCYPDVTELGADDVEPIDVLCGGFPCQDISVAGKGAGIDGARSGLWSEFARLIGELRPRYVVVENVPALLARGMGRVVGDLATLGYDAEWDCLPASAFGAPHRRDRVWIVAYPNTDSQRLSIDSERNCGSDGPELQTPQRGDPDRLHPDVAHPSRDAEAWTEAQARAERERVGAGGPSRGADLPHPAGARLEGREQPSSAREAFGITARSGGLGGGAWSPESEVGRVAHGVPDWVDSLSALGNALVPQIAEWIGGRILDFERRQNPVRW